MIRIVLIGYMGSGKTTVGRQLARRLDVPFYDLDWYIENRMRKRIPEIFAERGEEGFRLIERNMLHEVAEFENVVMSCGGGTPCFFDNIDYLNQQAATFYLKASPEVLYGHLRQARVERPLIKGKTEQELLDHIRRQLDEREPFYSRARHTVCVDQQTEFSQVGITVDKILTELGVKS